MRSLPLHLAAIFLVMAASPAEAKKKASPKTQGNGVAQLQGSLQAILNAAGPSAKTTDRDQGDNNAAARAIQVVCSKSTPASRRSAIFPIAISPQ